MSSADPQTHPSKTDEAGENVKETPESQPLSSTAASSSSPDDGLTASPTANGDPDKPSSANVAEGEGTGDNNEPAGQIKGQEEPGTAEQDPDPEPSPEQIMEQLSLSDRGASRGGHLRVDTGADYPPQPPQKDYPYLDPTPKTPQASRSPVGTPLESKNKVLPEVPASEGQTEKDGSDGKEPGKSEESQSEIQVIMEQFANDTNSLGQDEIMSPRLELADKFRTSQPYFPPRKSSLENTPSMEPSSEQQQQQQQQQQPRNSRPVSEDSQPPPAVPPKSPPRKGSDGPSNEQPAPSPNLSIAPPIPEPELDLPFDFHRFLEQLRHRTADPVAKFLRSFLTEFGKKQWMVHEQVKIISDFLTFITNKMAQCEVWRDVSDVEFDNAKEGMEKLVMNRLYSQTFSPAIPAPPAPPRSRSRNQRKDMERLQRPGRRGQHQEDVERDDILAQKIRIYSWIREQHLDIPPLGSNGLRFLKLAQQELLKIKGYRAPRDKVICVMNCCKVIFGLLRNSKSSDTSADSFVPLLIYVVLRANPEHLVSNIQYILRFRNQDKLGGEAGYYLSSLSGAIQFIETLDRTSLTVSDEDFEKNVEAAVSAIAERDLSPAESGSAEKSLSTMEGDPRAHAQSSSSSRPPQPPGDNEENPAVAGLLRTIQKPLNTIGRIFADDNEPQGQQAQPYRQQQPPPSQPNTAPFHAQQQQGGLPPQTDGQQGHVAPAPPQSNTYDAQEAAARQASAEAAEAGRIQRAEHDNVVETLSNMFPNLDKDVIDDVVRVKEGRVGLAVDACLALSAE